MTKRVLLLGRLKTVVDGVEHQIDEADVQIFEGTGIEDVRSTMTAVGIDHVIMGAGLDLELRLQIIREVFQRSTTTTVHMKDQASGPDGLLPFVRAILRGLKDYAS